ncbi:SCP2 sterol-binding domain-containing protein [Burkholderiaceae bacterium DAT-1]|nr:SCP2 sterol-binding domain-containing protein [Burkholderiaceae bacterium DAT-1]
MKPLLASLIDKFPVVLTTLPLLSALEVARKLNVLTPPEELDGHHFSILVSDLNLRARFSCMRGQFVLTAEGMAVDLEITAPAMDFLRLVRGTADADTLFFQRRLKIAGDTDLGLIVKNWLDSVEWPVMSALTHLS